MTTQRQAECQRAATPQVATTRRIEEVFATLGHELRNPLSALSNALEVWSQCKVDSAQTVELRHIMQRQVGHLIRLSDQLLDVSRITQAKLEICQEPVSLKQLIEGACEQVRPFIDRCGHTLTVSLPDEPAMVDGDPTRLMQVFVNLIQNAAKYTDRNGSLEVTVESQDATAVVRVHDNGQGIEQQMLSEIFEMFVQVAGTHGLPCNGLGIGLGLVKEIVELHGGSVAAHSVGLGQGSEFTVRLPLTNSAAHNSPSSVQSPVAGHNGQQPPVYRILVVDDDRFNRELLARLLRPLGHSVTVASDGEMAVRMVLAERPQVVLLDLTMPGLDGCEVACQLRGKPELANLVLIALSGRTDEKSRQRADDAGFDRYLVKPVDINLLVQTFNDIPALRPVQPQATSTQ